jgi:hypothetical protein
VLFGFRGGGGNRSRQAITDLYDEKRGAFLVQYPIWLVLTLGLVGIAAFAITGFTGYQPGPPFGEPWILYLWFCALVVTLQASIFRNRALRFQLVMTLIVTFICIALVGLNTFGTLLPEVIRRLLNLQEALRALATNVWTYTILNFGIIIVFWVDSIRRWLRRARGMAPTDVIPLLPGETAESLNEEDLPSLEELISGDLLAGAALTLLLSFLFSANFVHLVVIQPGVDVCTVSLPFAGCVSPGDPNAFYTLSYLDRIQSLIYLPFGLIILGLTATLSGLNAAAGVSPAKTLARLASAPRRESSATAPIAMDVTDTVVNTLRSAIDRRVRHLARNTALSLRTVAWPLLVLLCIYGVDQVALYVQRYLHGSKGASDALFQVGPALLWGVGAALALVASAALLIFRWRVADNSMRFLGLIGFVLLLTFWIFSLALAGFNLLLLPNLLNVTELTPFYPPGWSTLLSLIALAIFGAIAFIRRGRGSPPPSGPLPDDAPTQVPVGAENSPY